MNVDQKIRASAGAAEALVNSMSFTRLTKSTLRMTGERLAQHVTASDEPGLIMPVEVVRNGVTRRATVLVLRDRIVLVWFTGRVRASTSEVVIPTEAIVGVDQARRPAGALMSDREVLTVRTTDGDWTLITPDVGCDGGSIAPFVRGALMGGVRPRFAAV